MATEYQQFDIGDNETTAEKPKVEQLSVSTPQPDKYQDQQYLRDKAEKYAFGTGLNESDITRQLSAGDETGLRNSTSELESLRLRQEQNRVLIDTAKKLNRPLTEQDLDEFDRFSKGTYKIDPDTVLEELYGRAFSNLAITSPKDETVPRETLNLIPEAAMDGLDAVGRAVARNEIANDLAKELQTRHEGIAESSTPGQFFGELGRNVLEGLNPFGYGADKYSPTPTLSLFTDYAQIFLPGYYNVKMGGWRLNTGESLKEQYAQFSLLPPSEFKKRFKETVDHLAQDNLPLALMYVAGYQRYSQADTTLDNIFGYADWLAVGGTALRASRTLKRAVKGNKAVEAAADTKAAKAADDVTVPPVTDQEQIQHIKDFRQALKDTVKASHADNAEEAAELLGDVDGASVIQANRELQNIFKGLDPFDDTLTLRRKLASIFFPEEIANNKGSLSKAQSKRLTEHAYAHANKLLEILTSNHGATRLNDEQLAEAVRYAQQNMLKDYNHVNDAVLDVQLGGPFRTYTADEQLVNVTTIEMRLGRLPEPPKAPSKTALKRGSVESLVEYMTAKTDHNNKSQYLADAKKQYTDITREFNDAKAADEKLSFTDYLNKKQHTGAFGDMVHEIKTKTGKVTRGQLERISKELGLGPLPTGDKFLDPLNQLTARRGRVLVRDLYDAMKADGTFTGNLAEFRKQIIDARKSGKLVMSRYEQPYPNPAPARKPKPLTTTQTPKVDRTVTRQSLNDLTTRMGDHLSDVMSSLRVANPITGNIKFKLPRAARATKVRNFPDLANKLKASFNREVKAMIDAGTFTSAKLQELYDEYRTFVDKTRQRVPFRKGSKKTEDYNVEKQLAARARVKGGGQSPNEGLFAQGFEKYGYFDADEFRQQVVKDLDNLDESLAKIKADDDAADGDKLFEKGKSNAEVIAFLVNDNNADVLEGVHALRHALLVLKENNKRVTAKQVQSLLDEGKAAKSSDTVNQLNAALEEGNYASQFSRDAGYGNETYRNRLIDSEVVIKKPTQVTSSRRVHFVEPPKGWEPASPKAAETPPSRPQAFPKTEPKNEEELMAGLVELQRKLAKTTNSPLYDRVTKLLNNIEERTYKTVREPAFNDDQRILDLGELGSPYGRIPARRAEDVVEKRVVKKGLKEDEGFRRVGVAEEPFTLRKGDPDPSFVGRDYSTRDPSPPNLRKLSPELRGYYDKLERETYTYLNGLLDKNKVGYTVKMGKPGATLFKKRDEAAYWGTDVYGLAPNQYRIMQQGQGYYISIPRIVDEINDNVRDLRITTDNKVDDDLWTALTGWGKAPDTFVGGLSNRNRAVATYGPQEMHRLIQEAAKEFVKLPKRERSEVEDILVRNRDHVYVDENGQVRRGRFNQTFGDFEREFYSVHKKMPTDNQLNAYFDYVRYLDLDLALRDFHLVRDMGRLGLERTSIGFHVPTVDGKTPERASSKAFSSRKIDELPLNDPDAENFGVYVYNPGTRKGEFKLRTEIDDKFKADIDDKVANHGYQILELGNPLEKPLKNVAQTNEIINFVVVKDVNRVKYTFDNIPRRPGGHVRYQDEIFAKQPIMRKTARGWIYEGDETLLNFTTEAAARKMLPNIEKGRKLLKAGKHAELERHLAKNTPWDKPTFEAFFIEKTLPDGQVVPPRFSLDHEFTWTTKGRNTFDMSHYRDRSRNYDNFTNAIRSKYNLFANHVDKKFLGQRDPDVPALYEYIANGQKEPAFTLAKPRLIDPWEMINNSLSNVVRTKYLNDVKMQSAETFIEQFHTVMETPLDVMRRNPVFYLHNPVWNTATDNKAALFAGKHYRQATLNLVGTETVLGQAMNYTYTKLTDGIFKFKGQNAADTFTDRFRNAKNPVDMMRAMTFHSKLGLLNPVQFWKQASSIVHVAAIESPGQVLEAIPQSFAARWLALTDDPKMIEGMASSLENIMGGLGGFDKKLFMDGYRELKKTGFYNVGGEYANRDDFFDPKVFGSKIGKFLDKTAVFFTEGERSQRLIAWFVAHNKWAKANPGKTMTNAERARVLEDAHLLTNRMARNSNANIQTGSAAITFQFMSYQWRMAEAILGGSLSRAQRAKIALTYAGLYGIPVGLSAGLVYPFYDDIRQYGLENGWDFDDVAVKTLHEGIVGTIGSFITGEDYNIGKVYGPSGLDVIGNLFDEETDMLDIVLGASGSVVGDFLKSTDAAYDFVINFYDHNHAPPTQADFMEFFRNISTVNNLYRAYFLYNTKEYFTKNDSKIDEHGNLRDALMSFTLGVTPTRIGDTFIMLDSLEQQREAHEIAKREAIKYLKRAMYARQERDYIGMEAHLRHSKAALEAGKIPPKQYKEVLRRAYQGNKSLFESALKDFVDKAPPDQHEARETQALEEIGKLRKR